MSKKLQEWLASEQVRLATNSETRLQPEPTEVWLIAAVRRLGDAILHLTDALRSPEVCLAAVQQVGPAIERLTPTQCAQPLISHWIEANWDACIEILGRDRAREVAQAILAARQADAEGAQPTYEQARA
jgi:hypothetical protein